MRSFHLYVDDVREVQPRLMLLGVRDEARATAIARRVLGESEHHRGVELCENGVRVMGLGSFERRSCCAPRSTASGWRGARWLNARLRSASAPWLGALRSGAPGRRAASGA